MPQLTNAEPCDLTLVVLGEPELDPKWYGIDRNDNGSRIHRLHIGEQSEENCSSRLLLEPAVVRTDDGPAAKNNTAYDTWILIDEIDSSCIYGRTLIRHTLT